MRISSAECASGSETLTINFGECCHTDFLGGAEPPPDEMEAHKGGIGVFTDFFGRVQCRNAEPEIGGEERRSQESGGAVNAPERMGAERCETQDQHPEQSGAWVMTKITWLTHSVGLT